MMNIESGLDSFAQRFENSLKLLDAGHRKALGIIADHGWYVSAEMSLKFIYSHAEEILNGDDRTLDKSMLKYFKKHRKSIVSNLCKSFPNRAHIFREALKCHNKKLYHASTVLFTTQADGIFEGKLFRIKKEKQALKEFLDESEYSDYFIQLMTQIRGIDCDINSNSSFKSDLNRHSVMHGHSLEYGNEINSLKSLSLLCFIVDSIKNKELPST